MRCRSGYSRNTFGCKPSKDQRSLGGSIKKKKKKKHQSDQATDIQMKKKFTRGSGVSSPASGVEVGVSNNAETEVLPRPNLINNVPHDTNEHDDNLNNKLMRK